MKAKKADPDVTPPRPIEEGEDYKSYAEDYLLVKWAEDVRALKD